MSFKPIYIIIVIQFFVSYTAYGQNDGIIYAENPDSLMMASQDTTIINEIDTIRAEHIIPPLTPEEMVLEMESEKNVFIPNSTKAVWYSAIFPGLGQIYNRKYWKLPLIYGGFMGITYGLAFNQRNYTDYSIAYRDAMSDDPNANSYEDFVPGGWSEQQIRDAMKRKKDFYRRYRDLSIIGMIALYAACMIDAYVDAELYTFDISSDLSFQIEPRIVNDSNNYLSPGGYTVGIQCNIKF
ncbi:MAG: DUF5683 domain-containing protein [Candidatus Azobacteroides sp.]|nr:DUF5683 domain-containing protein [Candidatus Azobacteroides sp.]